MDYNQLMSAIQTQFSRLRLDQYELYYIHDEYSYPLYYNKNIENFYHFRIQEVVLFQKNISYTPQSGNQNEFNNQVFSNAKRTEYNNRPNIEQINLKDQLANQELTETKEKLAQAQKK